MTDETRRQVATANGQVDRSTNTDCMDAAQTPSLCSAVSQHRHGLEVSAPPRLNRRGAMDAER